MADLAYYERLLSNTPGTDNLGEADFLYRELIKLYRNNYDKSYEGFESDLIDLLIEGGSQGSRPGTIGRLRSPYITNDHAKYTVTSAWGPRNLALEGYANHKLQWHQGIDLQAAGGTACVTIAPGKIFATKKDGFNRVVVHHDVLPSTGQPGYTVYLHMSNIAVHTGQVVTTGQIVGLQSDVGSGGSNHLHFEVREASGRTMDPAQHLDLTPSNVKANLVLVNRWKKLLSAVQYHAVAPSTDPLQS